MENTGLSFVRSGITAWDGIWLQSAQPQFDMDGGGITILNSHTRNADSEKVTAFTFGYIVFRQSPLVRLAYGNSGNAVRHKVVLSACRGPGTLTKGYWLNSDVKTGFISL